MIRLNESGVVMKSTTMYLKQLNVERVRMAMQRDVIVTKNSLSQITGLSVATCGNILRELLKNGEIIELNSTDSTGGRPSKQFKYNKEYAYVVSMYIRIEDNEQSLCVMVSNLLGECVSEEKNVIENVSISDIDKSLDKVLKKYAEIKALSVGIPAVIYNGKASKITDLIQLTDVDITGHVKEKYNIPSLVENDVNTTALGYYNENSFEEDEPIVYLYYPKGICPGAGLIINGQIYKGVSNFAGEVAVLPINKDDRINQLTVTEALLDHLSKTLISIISIVNPKTIVISGLKFDEEIILKAKEIVEQTILREHMPDFVFRKDFHHDYKNGLTQLAIELLRNKIKIN
jgi:predicted NBD/HSP70 family sugar kinase